MVGYLGASIRSCTSKRRPIGELLVSASPGLGEAPHVGGADATVDWLCRRDRSGRAGVRQVSPPRTVRPRQLAHRYWLATGTDGWQWREAGCLEGEHAPRIVIPATTGGSPRSARRTDPPPSRGLLTTRMARHTVVPRSRLSGRLLRWGSRHPPNLEDLDTEKLQPGEKPVERCLIRERAMQDGSGWFRDGLQPLKINQRLGRKAPPQTELVVTRCHCRSSPPGNCLLPCSTVRQVVPTCHTHCGWSPCTRGSAPPAGSNCPATTTRAGTGREGSGFTLTRGGAAEVVGPPLGTARGQQPTAGPAAAAGRPGQRFALREVLRDHRR